MVPLVCRASIGVVGNGDHNLVNIGKADVNVTWESDYSSWFRNEPMTIAWWW